jgi:cytochrome d ubiquinol oxidase subunit II
MEIFANDQWLPLVFVILMGIAVFTYVILDGYDLGVGMLMALAEEEEKDEMIASIGPFWDANETWLVLSVGILLVAFPEANGIILGNLYLPVAIMLIGVIIRGVSFDFRAKIKYEYKHLWDKAFSFGSFLMGFSQGFMLGMYIVSFQYNVFTVFFSILTGICLVFGYCLMGSTWLIMKSENKLQIKSINWAKYSIWLTAFGMILVSVATPLLSNRIFEKWFSFPNIFLLFPIPLTSAILIMFMHITLKRLPRPNDAYCWVPFTLAAAIFVMGFNGLAYSFYPYIVPDQLTIWDAASSPESLKAILIGVCMVLPCIIGYTIFAYRVFWGKTKELKYY